MPAYSWKFQELFDNGIYYDIDIKINADNPEDAKKIIMNHIIKMTRFGIPRIFITSKGKIVISHSNDSRARNLLFVNIDYLLFQKILCVQPSVYFELNGQAAPFIPNTKSRH